MPRQTGFTLVELMTVVAIVGLLVALAIPNFVQMQLRAKRAEAPVNVDAIVVAEHAYDAAHDGFLVCPEHPAGGPSGKQAVAWAGGNTEFQLLGWQPDGSVRGAYSVELSASGSDFVASGRIDVDGDTVEALYTATRSIVVGATTDTTVY